MPERPVDPVEEELFDERNPFLDLLLGLISVSERTLATLVDLADPAPPEAGPPPRPSPPSGSILR